jgi:hypothetical protein
MLVAWGLGWWIGHRHRRRAKSAPIQYKFDDASLALMGLLLAFTFGMSISKHDQRRMMVVADSNAIGDFYTCASLLKEPLRTKLQGIIRKYTELRVALARQPPNEAVLQSPLAKADVMQGQMTELVVEAVNAGTPVAVSLTNALNGVTSDQARLLAAFRDRLSASIMLLLFSSTVVATLLIGRQQGDSGKVEFVGTFCFMLLVAISVWVILDLNQPMRA